VKKIKEITKNVLLAFVLISIGFALGKDVERRRSASNPSNQGTTEMNGEIASSSNPQRVVVYYTHGNFRCTTCTTIEDLTQQTLEKRFSDELANGLVKLQVVNFQENEEFAKRYEVVSSGVVVAGMKGDIEAGYKNLEEVWTKYNDPVAFENYLTEEVRRLLTTEEGGVE